MIRVQLRVEESYDQSSQSEMFSKALAEWHELEWVQYLHEHGEVVHAEPFKHIDRFITTWEVDFKLPEERETFFRLKWGHEMP